MATTQRAGLPQFWATTIAKVLVGDQPCLLSPWLQGRYTFEKRQQDMTQLTNWKANHTALLAQTVDAYRADGWKCSIEKFWRVKGETAIISGKADLVAQQTDKRPRIVDVKSGSPRESDLAQVMIQMATIPLSWNAPYMIFDGEVIYQTHTERITPVQAEPLKPKLWAMLQFLGTNGKPEASPSESSCRFCDAPAELCQQRMGDYAPVAITETTLF